MLNGGTGLDTVSYFDRTETVNVTLDGVANDGAPGENDKIIGVSGIIGGRGDDVLTGDAGPNGLFGGPGNDTVSGLDGTDQLEGGHGHDTVVGGPGGHDVATYEDANTHVDVSLDGVANDGGPGELDQVAPSVEDVSGTIFADHLAGNAGPNRLRGGGEGDTLEGLGGADDLQGGTGADVILAGDGSDLVHGDEGADVALLGAGNDAFVHPGGDGSDSIEGQDGSDTMRFDGTAFDDINEMTANGARLRFAGNGEIMDVNDVETVDYRALTGSDVLSVHDLSGTDVRTTRMDAGAGDARTDIVGVHGTGGADKPAVTFGAAGVQVNGLASRVLIAGTEGPNDHLSVQAGAGNDLITARAGLGALINLRVEGGLDEDTVLAQGTGAAETFDVTNGGTFSLIHDAGGVLSALTENLRVDGSGGDDVINGSSGLAASGVHLRLDGGAGNDKINGGDGEDFLIGGIGNDEVDGKAGADVAILGAGADAFSWLPGDGDDTVEGGADGDRVAFSGSVASESVKLAANGPRVSLTRDVGPVALDLAGVETIDYRALSGADVFTVGDVAGTGLKAANADLAAVGGGGDAQADRVVVIGTAAVDHLAVAGGAATGVHVTGLTAAVGVTHAEAANDELRINTLAGNDTVDTSAFAPGAIGLFIDGDPA